MSKCNIMGGIWSSLPWYPWIIPTIVFTILILGAAHMHPLWGDEAETALFGRNIIKYGVPKGWDGTNIMGINNAVVLDKNLINHTSPWLQYYLVALSFRLFGESSFTARLPFIILAILTQPLIYYVTKKITGDKTTAIFTSIISALSVQGILFGFQARYYQATNFLGLLLLLSVWRIIIDSVSLRPVPRSLGEGGRVPPWRDDEAIPLWMRLFRTSVHRRLAMTKKWLWPMLFILSSVLFFYSNYVSFAAFFVATIIGVVFYYVVVIMSSRGAKNERRGDPTMQQVTALIMLILMFFLPILALTLPWYLALQPFASRGEIALGSIPQLIGDFLNLFYQGLYQFHYNNIFPVGLVLLVLVVIIYKLVKKQQLNLLGFFAGLILIYLTLMSLFSTVALVDTVFVAGRYTTVILPIFYILAGLIFASLWRFHKLSSVVILILYLFTSTLKFTPTQSYFLDLLKEIAHPYSTAAPLVADYLIKNSTPGQTAFVNLDRDHEPLIFLLKDRLKFVNRVSLINTRIFPANRGIIPRYIYDYRDQPDWIILYSKRGNDGTFFTMDHRPLPPEINLRENYLEHKLPIFFSDLSRPEIDRRSFTEIIPTDPVDFVYIYMRRNYQKTSFARPGLAKLEL